MMQACEHLQPIKDIFNISNDVFQEAVSAAIVLYGS